MSKIDIATLDRKVKRIIDRIVRMERRYCSECKSKQPHQSINGALTCWKCGSIEK